MRQHTDGHVWTTDYAILSSIADGGMDFSERLMGTGWWATAHIARAVQRVSELKTRRTGSVRARLRYMAHRGAVERQVVDSTHTCWRITDLGRYWLKWSQAKYHAQPYEPAIQLYVWLKGRASHVAMPTSLHRAKIRALACCIAYERELKRKRAV
jgi:hypothetical protein